MRFVIVICLLMSLAGSALGATNADGTRQRLDWQQLPDLPDELGVAGPLVGVHNDVLIVAGGANFPEPYWENEKVWLDRVWALEQTGASDQWRQADPLDHPIAYAACVSLPQGIVCMGGSDGQRALDACFLMTWEPETQQVHRLALPDLPQPCVYGSAAAIGQTIYLAGGQSDMPLDSAMTNFWKLDLSKRDDPNASLAWEVLPPWPGPSRAFNLTVAQHNGFDDCIYVISGRRSSAPGKVEKTVGHAVTDHIFALEDVYEFNPARYDSKAFNATKVIYEGKGRYAEPWRRRANTPQCVMAGSGMGIGQSHIFVLSGSDGSLMAQADELRTNHPGFPRRTLAYHTITDTWIAAGESPANHVTTPAVKWGDKIIVASGEIKPRIRSRQVWAISTVSERRPFGAANYSVLAGYLLAMLGIGAYFARKNKNTDDYFRGGQKVLWWAAGCSIFATMLSSITYMAIPAKAFAQDWVYLLGNLMILAAAPVAVYLALPFFRQIDATSAYEYLQMRFNTPVRIIASAIFTVFQIFRMGIVLSLAALALSTIMDFEGWVQGTRLASLPNANAIICVLIMGGLSIVYCTMGGVEAVIWTDTIQTFVLLCGALLCLGLMIAGIDGGLGSFMETAAADGKFHMVNLHWDPTNASLALWVVILGSIGQNISSYSADQAVVQRYLTTPSIQRAASSIWTAAVMAIPASLLFFSLGAGLYVFYKSHPEKLDPTFMTDQIFPLFIARETPAGIAGLIVAGVFAAAQSTISTSMNSSATAVITDFIRPFLPRRSEQSYLRWARLLTFLLGTAGTLLGLLFVNPNTRSLFDEFLWIIGMFMGVLGGLFLLGILTRRANGIGGIAGALCGTLATVLLKTSTGVNGYLFAAVGIVVCFVVGYLVSLLFPNNKTIDGLTIYTLTRDEEPAR